MNLVAGVSTRLFAEIAVAVALAVVLGRLEIPLPHLIYGGSVSLETLPILIVAFRWGARAGLIAGSVLGIVDFLFKPIAVHPAQVFLDYPLAFGGVGWGAGIARGKGMAFPRLRVLAGILLGNGLRLLAHFVSGVIFFAAHAPVGQPVWLYSLSYNASYLLPQILFHILLLQMILRLVILHIK